jgi:hypothetical protein
LARVIAGTFVGAGAVVIAVGSIAFACSTYQGDMRVKGTGTGTAGATSFEGSNNCDAGSCGAGNGSMTWCDHTSSTTNWVRISANATRTVTISSVGSTCPNSSWNSHLPASSTLDVNTIGADAMSAADLVIVDADDCMTWILGSATVTKQGTVATDGSGAFGNTNVSVPSVGFRNSAGSWGGICVSTADGEYANQSPLRFE